MPLPLLRSQRRVILSKKFNRSSQLSQKSSRTKPRQRINIKRLLSSRIKNVKLMKLLFKRLPLRQLKPISNLESSRSRLKTPPRLLRPKRKLRSKPRRSKRSKRKLLKK